MGFFNIQLEKEIKKVKLLGIRTAEQTKVFSTVNSSMYCMIVLYTDGTKELIECESKEFQKKYLNFVDM